MKTENTITVADRSLIVGIACILLAVLFFVKSGPESRNSLTNDEVNTIMSQMDAAFDLAEEKILKVKPIPDNEPNGPNPDVDKCICKGTGIITHGDGHKTDCPYHAKKALSKSMECKEPRRIFDFFR